MSVVGVDLGTLNTVIAVARNRGVDVVSVIYSIETLRKTNKVPDYQRNLQSSDPVSNFAPRQD